MSHRTPYVQNRQISNFQDRTAQSINRCYTRSQLKKNEKKRIPNKKIAQLDNPIMCNLWGPNRWEGH